MKIEKPRPAEQTIFTPTTDSKSPDLVAVSDTWFRSAFVAMFGGPELSDVLNDLATEADQAVEASENNDRHAMDRIRIMSRRLCVAAEWLRRIEAMDEGRGQIGASK